MSRLLISILLLITSLAMPAKPLSSYPSRWENAHINSFPCTVFSMLQDKQGMMWLGTNSGLYSYDGHKMRHAASSMPIAWSQAHVHALIEYQNGLILGTNNGLFKYDKIQGSLKPLCENKLFEIRTMLVQDTQLWLGTLYGLYKYDLEKEELNKVETPGVHQAVYSLAFGKRGQIFVGTYDGLGCYYPLMDDWEVINVSKKGTANLFVNSLDYISANNTLWIGTETGLRSLSLDERQISEMKQFDDYTIKAIQCMSNGTICLGTDNGLLIWSADKQIELCQHNTREPASISNNVIWSLYSDHSGNLWCGSEDGISILKDESEIMRLPLDLLTGQNNGNQIYAIMRDSYDRLWLGGSNGAIMLDSVNKSTWFRSGMSKLNLSHNRIRQISQLSDGSIWFATDGSINRFVEKSNSMNNYRLTHKASGRNANWAYGMLEDDNGNLWVGSYLGGVLGVNYDKLLSSQGQCYADTVFDTFHGLPNDFVCQIVKGSECNMWVLTFRDSTVTCLRRNEIPLHVDIRTATGGYPSLIVSDLHAGVWCGFDSGICHLDSSGNIDGIYKLPLGKSENIQAMALVGQQVWAATLSEVWAIDPDEGKVHLLPFPQEAYTCIYYDDSRRKVLLGVLDAIYQVDPLVLFNKHESPRVIKVTEVLVDGAPFYDGDIYSTINSIDSTKTITLPHNYTTLSLDVSALNYSKDFPTRFSYTIDEGQFESDWQRLDEGTYRISIPRLSYGDHTLGVKIVGLDDKPLLIKMSVSKPWYLSWWAIAFYGLLIVLIVFGIYLYSRRRVRLGTERAERALTMATVQNRISFLTDMSHELKSPLAMIMGPISHVREEVKDSKIKRQLDSVYDNAVRLNTLIHRALEINRIENDNDKEKLILSRINIAGMAQSIIDNYKEVYPTKHFIFISNASSVMGCVDVVKIESIINNLVSNACKYTDNEATISCSVEQVEDEIVLTVGDDGVGIPSTELGLIFQRLFRSGRTANHREGTGIGLYLVKQYAELHHGSVEVQSQEDQGTVFIVKIPANIDFLIDSESIIQDVENKIGTDDTRPRILVVDDNHEIASFLSEMLSDQYVCLTAHNGRAALSVASTFHPDLIIADEMMPQMTGIEMSRKIRQNPHTSTIPIILLTAQDNASTEAASIEAGIDVFMSKPFDATMLKARIGLLISTRVELLKKARLETATSPTPVETESTAERQMAKITEVIETHIADPELNVNYICEATGISSKQLYRLLKKYVGVSPVDYLRQIRLRKAALLLEQNKFTVSEIMYMVGYSSTSYFAKCFQAQYGITPTQFAKETQSVTLKT